MDFGLSFHVLSLSEVELDSFAGRGIVLSSMMLLIRSCGLKRSLFILYVQEHNRTKFEG